MTDKPARRAFLTDPMLLRMLGFGFFSGLPLPLSIFTLQQWLTVSGINVRSVSHAAWLGLPYTLEFVWAPLFDRLPPRWAARFGRRRFWLLIIQCLLVLACVALALTDPSVNAGLTALAAGAVALCSASQDICINAWRIETFPPEEQGVALTAYIWGYRTAMFVTYQGAIALSAYAGWHTTLLAVAGIVALGPLLTLAVPEPPAPASAGPGTGIAGAIRHALIDPLGEFLKRPGAAELLALVLLFKLGKVFADTAATSYYHDALHLSSLTVAGANTVPYLIGTYAGAALGGILVAWLGGVRAVLLAGALQAASLGLYLALLAVPQPWMLYLKVGGEYFAAGAADTAFLAFISSLCAREYTATQYALLSSLATIAFHTLSGFAGDGVAWLGWRDFYAAAMMGGLPALMIAWHVSRRRPIAATES